MKKLLIITTAIMTLASCGSKETQTSETKDTVATAVVSDTVIPIKDTTVLVTPMPEVATPVK